MRRLAIASVVLAAAAGCASRGSGPAWPRGHATDGDGGESLAARLPAEVAEIEAHVDDTPAVPAAGSSASAAVAPVAVAPSTVAPAAPAATDDPPTVEEITIEIDD